jgi:hypothetical protein
MADKKTSWKEKRVLLVIGFFACIGMIIYIHFFKSKDKTDLAKTDLISVENLILKDNPIYDRVKSRSYINFPLLGYDKKFCVDNPDINSEVKNQILSNIKLGDTVSIGLTKDEFENIRNETFFDKKVEINSLRKCDKEYLDIDFRNNEVYKGSWDVIPALIYSAIMCLLFASFSKKPIIDPTLVIVIGALIITIITSNYF